MFYNNIVEIWGILNNQNLFENLRPIYEPYWFFFCIIYRLFYDGKNENFRIFFQTNEQKKKTKLCIGIFKLNHDNS